MNTQRKYKPVEISTSAMNDLIVDSIQDIKGKEIVKLDLRDLEDSPTDFFIICQGDSNTQVRSIAENIYKRLKIEGATLPTSYEGQNPGTWICLDYFTTVVHVFYTETRATYELEELWSDAHSTYYENL